MLDISGLFFYVLPVFFFLLTYFFFYRFLNYCNLVWPSWALYMYLLQAGALTPHYVFIASQGFDHARASQVPTWAAPAAGERGQGTPPAGVIRHRHASTASIHLGNQDQEHDLQDQAQVGLHANGL